MLLPHRFFALTSSAVFKTFQDEMVIVCKSDFFQNFFKNKTKNVQDLNFLKFSNSYFYTAQNLSGIHYPDLRHSPS